jgi:hypothetical protein
MEAIAEYAAEHPLPRHGKLRKNVKNDKGYNVPSKDHRGNSAEHLARRLAIGRL